MHTDFFVYFPVVKNSKSNKPADPDAQVFFVFLYITHWRTIRVDLFLVFCQEINIIARQKN